MPGTLYGLIKRANLIVEEGKQFIGPLRPGDAVYKGVVYTRKDQEEWFEELLIKLEDFDTE